MTQRLQNPPKFYLNVKKCKIIYTEFKSLIDFEEPLPAFEEQYPNQLESALESVAQSFAGQQLFPTVLDAATAYYSKIACGHIFVNGNKRLGILYTHVFLIQNQIDFTLSRESLYIITEELAGKTQKGVHKKEVEAMIRRMICDLTEDLDLSQ